MRDLNMANPLNQTHGQIRTVMTRALSNQPTQTPTSEVSKLLTTMKNIGSYKYEGRSDPIEADKWISMMDKNFEAMECPEEHKKRIDVYYL